jgi:hypothetical protein
MLQPLPPASFCTSIHHQRYLYLPPQASTRVTTSTLLGKAMWSISYPAPATGYWQGRPSAINFCEVSTAEYVQYCETLSFILRCNRKIIFLRIISPSSSTQSPALCTSHMAPMEYSDRHPQNCPIGASLASAFAVVYITRLCNTTLKWVRRRRPYSSYPADPIL